ncbi:uncharacterized protein BYT42DRAFT_185083 [Radiomyces spectabilis]|uniref:uncharacterized protein n=1 Tax=Radiomyces spectabilis TaxID=64574 RepID=UPI00222006F3|nr:uncharacterized protein BYT42DRAFT_185083 [Radiomyces spectabilis]KAI8391188.1 hypothetical protein BYT42DRAFT_185083 [Radiomyces spectabilis]
MLLPLSIVECHLLFASLGLCCITTYPPPFYLFTMHRSGCYDTSHEDSQHDRFKWRYIMEVLKNGHSPRLSKVFSFYFSNLYPTFQIVFFSCLGHSRLSLKQAEHEG